MKREAVYDKQISPLMEQIIKICKEHDIPAVASFQLDDDRGAAAVEEVVKRRRQAVEEIVVL